ncbi:hypothetical protein ANCDUO_26165, partial [Ancylostoma duodenale]
DGFEDLRRWRYDNKINKNTCHVWDRSSDESGSCYVETSNLDGETSLKQRLVPRQYVSFSKVGDGNFTPGMLEDSNFTPPQFTGTVFCEPPDPAFYTIRAKIEYEP